MTPKQVKEMYGMAARDYSRPDKNTMVHRRFERSEEKSLKSGYSATRSVNGLTNYEISLPSDAVTTMRRDWPLSILKDGATQTQVGAVLVDQDGRATAKFSRSRTGQESRRAFETGRAALSIAYLDGSQGRKPVAFSLRAVSDGTRKKETDMSDATEIAQLGAKHGKDTLAVQAIAEGKSLTEFRSTLLEAISNKPLATPWVHDGEERSFSLLKAINAEIASDWSMAGYEREVCQEAKRAYGAEARGIVVPHSALSTRATMVSTGDISGAIGTQLRPDMFVDVMRPMSSVIAAGGRVMTLNGKTSIPKNSNDVSASWTAENASITESDLDIDTITLEPHLLAGRSSYTRTVLATAQPDIEQLIRSNLASQIANGLDDAALDGSGSGAVPQGISNATGIETFATAGSSTMTHSESLDAIAEVGANNYDTSNGVWLVHPTNAATLGAQAKDSGSGQFVYQDGTILGRRVIETTHVSAGTVFFGLFQHVMIGTFSGLDIVVDPYTNGSTGVVNIYAYQLADIGVLRPDAFQKITLTA